ncbi:MAG: hypothetical protein WB586_26840, partial [Chthoniobacterales bacterium]
MLVTPFLIRGKIDDDYREYDRKRPITLLPAEMQRLRDRSKISELDGEVTPAMEQLLGRKPTAAGLKINRVGR